MKTAVIITGAMRSFERCLPNLDWHVFRHFPDAKFYVATHDDEDAIKAALLGPRLTRMEKFVQPEMVVPDGCPDKWTQGQPYMHEPYAISVPPSHVLGQLWINEKGWNLYKEAGEPADLVIRCRPDLWFHSFQKPHGINQRTYEVSPFVGGLPNPNDIVFDDVAFTPWWGRFGGVNDRFALLGQKAAEAYFTTYSNTPNLIKGGAPLHPESLVYASMKQAGISVCDDMLAEFSTLRKTGELRHPEITGIDIAHLSTKR